MKHEATLPHRVQRVCHRFQHHRFKDGISIDESSDHRITKKRKKNSATCLHSGKGNEISKRGAKEAGGTRWKIDRSRSRFGREDGSTSPSDPASRMVAAHASMAAFLLFFRSFFSPWPTSLSLSLSLSALQHSSTDSLARQEVPLFSRSWQIRLMRWTRWDMGQRIGVQCRHGRGVTVPWKRPCSGPQSRRELSAGWSPV